MEVVNKMYTDEDQMQDISVHRIAGIAGQLNIETTGLAGQWLEGNSQ